MENDQCEKVNTTQMGLVPGKEMPRSVSVHEYYWKAWPSQGERTKLAVTQAFPQLLLFLTTL